MKLAPVRVFSCKHPLSRCFTSVPKIQSTPLLSVKVVPVVLITKTTRDQSTVIYAKNFWFNDSDTTRFSLRATRIA